MANVSNYYIDSKNKLISDNFAFIYSADYDPDLHIEKATKEKE